MDWYEDRLLIDGELVAGLGRRDLRERQPRDRGDARDRGRRDRRRRGSRDHRRPAGVRHDRMVTRPRVPPEVPAPTAPGARGQLRPSGEHPRAGGRRADLEHQRSAARGPDRGGGVVRRSARPLRLRRGSRRSRGLRQPAAPLDRERGRRRRRRHRRVQLPDPARAREARARARGRVHGGAQGCAGHAVGDARARQAHRRVDGDPAGRRERPVVVRPRGRRGAHDPSRRRRRLVHRLDAGRAPDHGGGECDGEARVPRAGRKVGARDARRRRPGDRRAHGLLRDRFALGPGLRDHVTAARAARPLRRRRRPGELDVRRHPVRRPDRPRDVHGAADQRAPA